VQTGGPDGDLGSNEILQSSDRTVALIDVSGVAFDPAGLSRVELERLARGRLQIKEFNSAALGPGGFRILVDDRNIVLPDGSRWKTGIELRDRFVFTRYARADIFVPCGGRPATINLGNVTALLSEGAPWRMMVEGANLFCTEDARRRLEEAGVHVFKDSSANKGGVTSSSLEVLASLALSPKDHDRHLSVLSEDAPVPAMYSKYVEEIIHRIEENCRDEFHVIWNATQSEDLSQSLPQVVRKRMLKIDASRQLSQEITVLKDHIAAAELPENVVRKVLAQAVPSLIVDHCSLDGLLERLPSAYVKATVAFWLASKYVYKHGVQNTVQNSTSFNFHEFMERFYQDEAGEI
jgi:glutamate dehydrogenase